MQVEHELSTIVEGMTICDVNGNSIGVVETFRFSKESPEDDESNTLTIKENLEQVIGANRLPEELNSELYKSGFLYIECGFLRDNVIVFPHQIEAIDGEEICLNISKDEVFSC